MTAAEIPIHLWEAANQELQVALEECHHPTKLCSHSLFGEKLNTDKLKVEIVSLSSGMSTKY